MIKIKCAISIEKPYSRYGQASNTDDIHLLDGLYKVKIYYSILEIEIYLTLDIFVGLW